MSYYGISRCCKISAGTDEIQIPDMTSATMATFDALRGAAHIQCAMGLIDLAEQCMDPPPEAPLAGMDDCGCTPTPGPPPNKNVEYADGDDTTTRGPLGANHHFMIRSMMSTIEMMPGPPRRPYRMGASDAPSRDLYGDKARHGLETSGDLQPSR